MVAEVARPSTAKIDVYRHADAAAFLDRVGRWLARAEAENNLVLSVAELLLGRHPFDEPLFLGSIETRGALLGCALLTPPDGLYLTALPDNALPALAEALAEIYPRIADLIAPARTAEAFAPLWAARSGEAFKLGRRRLFVLHEVFPLERCAQGALRHGATSDAAVLEQWARRYAVEVGTHVDVCLFVERLMSEGGLYIWDDGGPKGFVTVSGHTRYGSRISAVYTPDEYRGHGYATSAVAAAAQRVLDAGKHFCVLYTDLEQPAPNRIYPRIGFRPLSDHVAVEFG